MLKYITKQNNQAETSDFDGSTTSISLSGISFGTSSVYDNTTAEVELPKEQVTEKRVVGKPEIAMIEAKLSNKLNTIVTLVYEFSIDAFGMREDADILLDELRTKILPYLTTLDIEMCSAEAVLRYNIDQSKINEPRVEWLLTYTKYQMELRRVFDELAGTIYNDLEDSLELRKKGCVSRRPCSTTIENLLEMKRGMQRAVTLLCGGSRSVA